MRIEYYGWIDVPLIRMQVEHNILKLPGSPFLRRKEVSFYG